MNILINQNNNISINKITFVTILISLFFPDTNKSISSEIHIAPLQKLTLINKLEWNNLTIHELNQGYQLLENCIELEIKSNISWSIIVSDDNPNNNGFFIKTNQSSLFKPISNIGTQILFSPSPSSSSIIKMDCKRLVNWKNSKPQKWNFSPIFKIEPLK